MDYSGADALLEQYYNGLADKTDFEDSVEKKYAQASDNFNDKQTQRIAAILDSVDSAKELFKNKL